MVQICDNNRMASQQSTVDQLLQHMSGVGDVSAKKMFGEYGIYLDGKMFAMVCDDTFFVKPTKNNADLTAELDMGSPYPGAKPCYIVSIKNCSETEWISELVTVTVDDLPAPKPKAPKKK